MHDPIKVLREEHHVLTDAINTAKQVQEIKDKDLYHTKVHNIILFFRHFTEMYHYPKEDKILYPYLKNGKHASAALINELYNSHEDLEQLLAEIIDAHVVYDHAILRGAMALYIKELEMQIAREDEELLNPSEKAMTKEDAARLYNEFAQLDAKEGAKETIFKKIQMAS